MSQNSFRIRYFQGFHEPSEFIQILIHHDFLYFTFRIKYQLKTKKTVSKLCKYISLLAFIFPTKKSKFHRIVLNFPITLRKSFVHRTLYMQLFIWRSRRGNMFKPQALVWWQVLWSIRMGWGSSSLLLAIGRIMFMQDDCQTGILRQ